MATTDTMTCQCCGGDLPMRAVWESFRHRYAGPGCGLSGNRCRVFGDDAWAAHDMAKAIAVYGDRFTGGEALLCETAEAWIAADIGPAAASRWCQAGVWNPDVARALFRAGVTPLAAEEAAERLVEDRDDEPDAGEEYTDGCPIYSVCNGDYPVELLIEAANS